MQPTLALFVNTWLLPAVQAAFLRRLPCSPLENAAVEPFFEPSSLSGYLMAQDDTTTLSLKVLGNYTFNDCDSIGGALAHITVDAKVLGQSVVSPDQQLDHMVSCPVHSPKDYPRHPLRLTTHIACIPSPRPFRLRLNESDIACFSANITPHIGRVASRLLKAVPFAIMVLTGLISGTLKTVWDRTQSSFRYELADAFNDPAESDFPGLGECLQYIQFVIFMGCLTLSYPGFFRASVSELAWSSLISKNWPITHQFVYPGVQDDIYAVNATFGMEEMAQYLGATTVSDVWTNAVINLALMVVGGIVTVHLVWLGKRIWQSVRLHTLSPMCDPPVDPLAYLRHIGWAVARIVVDYFLFPIVAFSLHQPLMASWFPVYRTFLTVAFVAVLAASLAFIVRHLLKNSRQRHFFQKASFPMRSSDDYLSSCLYGIPFLRGLAVGAVQTSGLGQILILGACELYILACMLCNRHSEGAWRHIVLSSARLIIVTMSCAFLPQVGAGEETKDFVGYTILAVHSVVLLSVFIGDCIYEMIKLILYKLGVLDLGSVAPSHESQQTPIFGIGQLSRRSARRISFARLPTLTPANHHIPSTGEAIASGQASFLGEYDSKSNHTSFFRSSRSDTTSIRSTTASISPAVSLGSVQFHDLHVYRNVRDDVDYSIREADQYYCRSSVPQAASTHAEQLTHYSGGWKHQIFGWWRWKRKPKRTSGLQVIRANVPASQSSPVS